MPNFNREVFKEAMVFEGDEVMTLRPDVQGTPKLSVEMSGTLQEHGERQALYHSINAEEWIP